MGKTNLKKNGSPMFMPAIYTLALIAAAVFLTAFSASIIPHGRGVLQDENCYTARLLLSGFNIILCAYLIMAYVRDYLALRSGFMLGVIAFLFAFLLYGLSSFPPFTAYLGYSMQGTGGMGAFSLVPTIFTAIALLIFIKISQD